LGTANWVHFYPLNWIKKGIFLGGDAKGVGIMMHINGDTYPYWKIPAQIDCVDSEILTNFTWPRLIV
jgi:hypothetical protein